MIQKLSHVNGKPTLVNYQTRVRQDNDRVYNKHRRLNKSEYVKFYNSRAWKKTRQAVLLRDMGLCQRCGLEGNIVDHIVRSDDSWSDRLNEDNLETLCKHCHQLKSDREYKRQHEGSEHGIKIHVVVGLRGVGKSDWVNRHKGNHDLVFDVRKLYQLFANNQSETTRVLADGKDALELVIDESTGKAVDIMGNDTGYVNGDTDEAYEDAVSEYIELYYELLLRKLKSEDEFDNVWIVLEKPDERLKGLLSNYHDIDQVLVVCDSDELVNRLKSENEFEYLNKIKDKIKDFDKSNLSEYRRVKL